MRRPTPEYESYRFEGRASPLALKVTREGFTEPPFDNEFYNNDADGLYCCVCCGVPLFDSKDKYKCSSGWPSFTRSVLPNLLLPADYTHGMTRIEVRCPNDECHLGHLFHDGPAPRNTRYCINSAALIFKPRNETTDWQFLDNGCLAEFQWKPKPLEPQ